MMDGLLMDGLLAHLRHIAYLALWFDRQPYQAKLRSYGNAAEVQTKDCSSAIRSDGMKGAALCSFKNVDYPSRTRLTFFRSTYFSAISIKIFAWLLSLISNSSPSCTTSFSLIFLVTICFTSSAPSAIREMTSGKMWR